MIKINLIRSLRMEFRRHRRCCSKPGEKPQFKHGENTGEYVLKEGKGVLIGTGVKR